MSFDNLITSVNTLRDTNAALTTTVREVQVGATVARDQAEAFSIAALASVVNSRDYSIQAKQALTDTEAAAAAVSQEVSDLHAYVEQVQRKFSIYVFEKTVVTGDKLMRIAPQFNLEAQSPAIDWVGSCDSAEPCILEFKVVTNGVPATLPINVLYLAGSATITVDPHSINSGDIIEIACISGSATNLAFTARYDGGTV